MNNNQWLAWINCALFGLISICLLSAALVSIGGTDEIGCPDPEAKECRLPRGAFTQPSDSYVSIGEPVLALKSAPPTVQLPDLRQHLNYYGKNGRPDAQTHNEVLHFSFAGSKQVTSIQPGEKLYLRYDKSQTPAKYTFSPDNAPTSLWLVAELQGLELHVNLFMRNEQGDVVSDPPTHAHFKLTEKEYIRHGGASWSIGSWNVDGSLLVRQKAKWYGPDHFLDQHGGEEFIFAKDKQRLDFGEPDELYSVFVAEGDSLIWKENRWQATTPGVSSLGYPLLMVKKIDERLMSMELWDVAGKGKVILNLLKSVEPWMAQNGQIIHNTFKYVGARTRTKYVFEVNQERLQLSPQDWLVFMPSEGGWKKLDTAESIDEYVSRKKPAALFVFEGVSKGEGQQLVVGKLFSPSRSEFKLIELPINQAAGVGLTAKKISDPYDYDDDDSDDDEDDDDYSQKIAQNIKPSVPSKVNATAGKK